ncbi:MAG TPA: plasmid pRiA4b ORF-3 family protein [Chitinophagaceae bacterium]|nr:plasmid pRiA4b ORF-3 family protein [Chitinophagaceae bacterium]
MTLQFKIQLRNISKPPVWRKLIVPDNFSFMKFHQVIQDAFGWYNCHLFEFSPTGYGSYPVIGIPEPGPDRIAGMQDARKIKLSAIFREPGQCFTYTYDYGDDWVHKITLEKITDEKRIKASLLAGTGACPPEDCGGSGGYAELRSILADPKHPGYQEMKEWLDLDEKETWDAKEFDLEYHQFIVSKV